MFGFPFETITTAANRAAVMDRVLDFFGVAPIVPTGDFDDDGIVDGADFLAWQRGFGAANSHARRRRRECRWSRRRRRSCRVADAVRRSEPRASRPRRSRRRRRVAGVRGVAVSVALHARTQRAWPATARTADAIGSTRQVRSLAERSAAAFAWRAKRPHERRQSTTACRRRRAIGRALSWVELAAGVEESEAAASAVAFEQWGGDFATSLQ